MRQRKRWNKMYSELAVLLNLLYHGSLFTFYLSYSYSSCVNWQLRPVFFCSSTLKICCFSHSKANPKTSALQSLQKFMASLCALFLNMGSNILWSPPVLNVGSDYLLTNALYMSKHSSWCAGA